MNASAMNYDGYYHTYSQENIHQETVRDVSEQKLIETHLVMVKRIAYHLKSKLPEQVPVEDLIQAGMLGLIESAKKFDENQGASFETYAGIRVRGAMLDEIRRNDWTPRSVHKNTRLVAEAVAKVEHEKGRKSTDMEIAKAMDISLDEYHQMMMDTHNHRVLSIDETAYNDEAIIEKLPNQQPLMVDGIYTEDMKKLIARTISQLPKRESLVMALYYNEELNLREIGAILGVSESRVCQIHSQAMAHLRVKMKVIIEEC